MQWESKAVEEFIRIPVAKSALENVKVTSEKFARRKKLPQVTMDELDTARKLCYGDVPEAVRLKELDKRIAEGETTLKERMAADARDVLSREIDLFKVDLCHAKYFRCRSQIIDVRNLGKEIEQKLRELKVSDMVADSIPDDERLMAHHRFTVSISGCPNACTGPETRPFGIHGISKPMVTAQECSECFACVDRCRRGAIVIRDGGPQLNFALCDMCENCVKVCPTGALVSERKGHRIMVGGKFGRFNKAGYELFKIADTALLMTSLEAALDFVEKESVGHEDLFSLVNRIGVAPIFMRIFNVNGGASMDKTNLTIKGMSCQHCVDRVTKALKAVPGVAAVQVDLGNEQAAVEFDASRATLADMSRAVESSGYKVLAAPAPRPAAGDSCCG